MARYKYKSVRSQWRSDNRIGRNKNNSVIRNRRSLKKGQFVHFGSGSAIYTIHKITAAGEITIRHNGTGVLYAVADNSRLHHCT